MSRLGDLIRLERTRQGLTHKQVARKCGVSDKYLMEVEAGTRIIQDDQARRILKSMGLQQQTEADFTLDDIAATVDLQSAVPQLTKAVETKKSVKEKENVVAESDPGVSGSIWLDALSGVLKHVPIYNAVMKEVGHRLLPITNGKIEGASPDKVFYFMAPDNELRGFRVQRGDLLLVVPAQAAVDGAIMLIQTPQGRLLRKVKRVNDYQAMLQKYNESCESEIKNYNEITFVGRCVRLEADLG
ncbi:MAG: helix-turn-helix transcriptional regulator [Clostridiales bacterium]|nr:helix-turn-helix transcriptional regulator [Clostridiales bacterium]